MSVQVQELSLSLSVQLLPLTYRNVKQGHGSAGQDVAWPVPSSRCLPRIQLSSGTLCRRAPAIQQAKAWWGSASLCRIEPRIPSAALQKTWWLFCLTSCCTQLPTSLSNKSFYSASCNQHISFWRTSNLEAEKQTTCYTNICRTVKQREF